MTLDTRVYVLDPIGHRDVFLKCNQLIGAHEGIRWTDEQDKSWAKGKSFIEPGNRWTISNRPGQGLCAWLMIHYRPDAPLVGDGEHQVYCEPDAPDDPPCDCFPHQLEISLDTAYGYRGDNGEGCGDLHARIVFELGQWLDERGVRWKWQNEFTGEIHEGYGRLGDLCSGGSAAQEWFAAKVAPAIAAMGATS